MTPKTVEVFGSLLHAQCAFYCQDRSIKHYLDHVGVAATEPALKNIKKLMKKAAAVLGTEPLGRLHPLDKKHGLFELLQHLVSTWE